jgi:membrane associated rhomboid family serine protease
VAFSPSRAMLRKRGENLRTVYVFLFLNLAFFFLEYQDANKFATLFSFDRASFAAGQYWRLLTYQFTQAGQGWFFFPKPLILFFTLLILYLMGSTVEEEWGTLNFLIFFLISTVVSAVLASWLGVPLLGSYFVNYTLLFVYASMFPDQTFYLFAIVPIRVRWLAYLVGGLLLYGAVFGGTANIAVLGGAIAGYAFYLLHRAPVVRLIGNAVPSEPRPRAADMTAVRNAGRFVAIKKSLAGGSQAEVDRMIALCESEIAGPVNICPPADYKPENSDGYCIRCEGFAECSARYLRLQQKRPVAPAASTVSEASV